MYFLEIGRNGKFLLTTMVFFFILKNILQRQQCVKSLLRAFEPIRIPSSAMTFAVIRSLVLMRLQNWALTFMRFSCRGIQFKKCFVKIILHNGNLSGGLSSYKV